MKNVIFDVGGIITNFSDEILVDYLNIPLDDIKKFTKSIYHSYEWRECLKGNITQDEFLKIYINKYPDKKDLLNKYLLKENQKYILPIFNNILDEIKNIKNKYNIYILSNMTDSTYEYLNNLNVFDIFDGGIYSFKCGLIKPGKDIYELLIKTYNLKIEECIFFDDTLRNIEASNKIGIKSVLYKNIEDLRNNLDY